MNQTLSPQTSPATASADRGRAKVNPQPRRAYRITLTLKDAPGAFALVEGRAQYDITNENECGHINPAAGVAERITSNEPFALTKVSDTEYEGTVYLDLMQDEDYYGRGVCHWGLTEARALLRATGDASETEFVPKLDAQKIAAGQATTLYFWKDRYPRSEMDNYGDFGRADRGEFKAELQKDLFSITLASKEVLP